MQGLLLIAIMLMIFVLGFYLMGKLDLFLKENYDRQMAEIESGDDALHIRNV